MNLTNPFSTPSLPGVAGPATSGQPVVYDPTTGLYVNQATGAVSTDPGGQHPVQNPSLATQAARNISISNGLLSKLSGYGNQFNQAFGDQSGLVGTLKNTINGVGPSVARSQLEQGLGQIRSAENSEAAGATGANGALAREAAMLGTAQAGAAENQAEGVARANEVANAENTEAGVLGNQAGEAGQMYGTNLSGAETASGQAGQEEGQKEQLDQQAREQQNQMEFNLLQGAGQTAALAATGGASAPVFKPGGNNSAFWSNPTNSAYQGAFNSSVAVSDENEKTDVKKLSDGDMEKLLGKISGYGFEYDHPGSEGEAPGKRVGVMAQDLEKAGPAGKVAVVQGSPMKLDLPNAVGAALAAVAYLKKRIDAEHGRKAA